ncbi:helix-turn-helix domain-containing protein [Kocuria rosea]|nr:helix-turn-helix domain-containing protein [Kocuria rosea]
MSAQELAEVCTQLGVPMKRTSIANLENGRRDSISVTDLIAIANALDVPPITLIYPHDQAGAKIEAVPGLPVMTFDALTWFSGERPSLFGGGDAASDPEYSILRNLRNILAAEASARHFLRHETDDFELQKQMVKHAVSALRGALSYRETCNQLLAHPLPIPDDLALVYIQAKAHEFSSPEVL